MSSVVCLVYSTGPSCSKTDYANPGLVKILIVIYLRLKEDFSQD